MITKKDRIYAVLKGEILDRVPTGFWMHFPENCFFGDNAVHAHLEFFEKSKTDMCKVMTENLYPCFHNINDAKDWINVRAYDWSAPFIQNQADLIQKIVKEIPNASVMGTVHGVIASSSHLLLGIPRYDSIGSHAIIYHARMEPEIVISAFEKISETLSEMARAQIKAGADGIYYAALGGESYLFSDEEHASMVAPFDQKVIDAAYEAGAKYVVLHICKPRVNLERFKNYRCDIVNWGVEESGVALSAGRELFGEKILLGGFNTHHGALIEGTEKEIQEETIELIKENGPQRYILGSDCTLPGDLDYSRIATVSKASEKIGK